MLSPTGKILKPTSNVNKTDEITRSVCANAARNSASAPVAEAPPHLAQPIARIARKKRRQMKARHKERDRQSKPETQPIQKEMPDRTVAT